MLVFLRRCTLISSSTRTSNWKWRRSRLGSSLPFSLSHKEFYKSRVSSSAWVRGIRGYGRGMALTRLTICAGLNEFWVRIEPLLACLTKFQLAGLSSYGDGFVSVLPTSWVFDSEFVAQPFCRPSSFASWSERKNGRWPKNPVRQGKPNWINAPKSAWPAFLRLYNDLVVSFFLASQSS